MKMGVHVVHSWLEWSCRKICYFLYDEVENLLWFIINWIDGWLIHVVQDYTDKHIKGSKLSVVIKIFQMSRLIKLKLCEILAASPLSSLYGPLRCRGWKSNPHFQSKFWKEKKKNWGWAFLWDGGDTLL